MEERKNPYYKALLIAALNDIQEETTARSNVGDELSSIEEGSHEDEESILTFTQPTEANTSTYKVEKKLKKSVLNKLNKLATKPKKVKTNTTRLDKKNNTSFKYQKLPNM